MGRRFELVLGTSAKFWEIDVANGTMTVRFGRLGTDGQTQKKKLGAKAEATADKLVAEKLRKGYREVGKKAGATKPTAKAVAAKTTKATPAKGKANGKADAAAVKELGRAILAYAPTYHGKLRGASSVKPLEKVVPVPEGLRALWSWANGAEELIITRASELEAGMDLLTVEEAAEAVAMLREEAGFPEDHLPFAGDGAGNFTVVDADGRVRDWDHETRESPVIAPSLAALLALTMKAIAKKALFGGPEKKPGKVDPRVKRVESMLAKAETNRDRIVNDCYRLAPADALRIALALRDALMPTKPEEWIREQIFGLIARVGSRAGAFDEAIKAVTALGKSAEATAWTNIGRQAAEAGTFEAAGTAFANALKRDKKNCEALVGVALSAQKAGQAATKEIAAAERELARTLAELEKRLADEEAKGVKRRDSAVINKLAWHLSLKATLEMMRGQKAAAERTVKDAVARCTKDSFEVRELGIAAGLAPSPWS